MRLIASVLPFVLMVTAWGQSAVAPVAVVNDQQIMAVYDRSLQLIEASGIASAELGRAGAPIAENIRQNVESLKFLGVRNPQLHYAVMGNLRAFLLIADAIPKAADFSATAKQQLQELRDNLLAAELYFQKQVADLQTELRSSDRDNTKRYQAANANLAAPNPKVARVVFLGDSITDFWRLNEYFPGKDYVNRGISGQITGQMAGRFLADVAALKPTVVVVLAGTNDIARGVDPAQIRNNLTVICDLADARKIKVVLASVLPVSDHHKGVNPSFERTKQRPMAAILEMNRWLEQFCQTRGYVYLNYYPALAGADGQLMPNMADDGLHPNPTGYRVMAPLAQAAIEKSLSGAISTQPAGKKFRLFQ